MPTYRRILLDRELEGARKYMKGLKGLKEHER